MCSMLRTFRHLHGWPCGWCRNSPCQPVRRGEARSTLSSSCPPFASALCAPLLPRQSPPAVLSLRGDHALVRQLPSATLPTPRSIVFHGARRRKVPFLCGNLALSPSSYSAMKTLAAVSLVIGTASALRLPTDIQRGTVHALLATCLTCAPAATLAVSGGGKEYVFRQYHHPFHAISSDPDRLSS